LIDKCSTQLDRTKPAALRQLRYPHPSLVRRLHVVCLGHVKRRRPVSAGARRQCLKRKIVLDEIAKFTVFLASDEASACTSQHYVVDGGWM
jgi:hypothetical protein